MGWASTRAATSPLFPVSPGSRNTSSRAVRPPPHSEVYCNASAEATVPQPVSRSTSCLFSTVALTEVGGGLAASPFAWAGVFTPVELEFTNSATAVVIATAVARAPHYVKPLRPTGSPPGD